MTRTKGWARPQASRCRASHYVYESDKTRALCGATIRTLVAPKRKGGWELCDHCQREARRGVR